MVLMFYAKQRITTEVMSNGSGHGRESSTAEPQKSHRPIKNYFQLSFMYLIGRVAAYR